MKVLSREMRQGCPKELFYADDLTLVSGSLGSLKGNLETWKRPIKSNGLKQKWSLVDIKLNMLGRKIIFLVHFVEKL